MEEAAQFMNWSGSDILQAVSSFISLVIVGGLVGWIYRLYGERVRSLKERHEGEVKLLEQRLKLKSEEVESEKEATRRYKVVADEHKEYLERQLLDIQRKAGIAPDEALPDKPIELSEELKRDIGEILARLEEISIELPLPTRDTLLGRGSAYAATGQYEKAIKAYSEVIRLKPDLVAAYHNRGIAYMELDQPEAAKEDFSKVIELEPQRVEGYCNRGRAYNRLEKPELALKDLNKVLELDPQHAAAYHNRGNAYRMLGKYKKALEDFSKAMKLEPDYI